MKPTKTMAKKDPAFLLYSKDWLEGTADLLPEEKGVFIDLLCYQHQRGFIPNDISKLSRLVGLTESKFKIIWKTVSHKFHQVDNQSVNHLVNHKLVEVMGDRVDRGIKNRIVGIFASLIRQSDLTKKEISDLKKKFKTEDFIQFSKETLTERLTEWFTKEGTSARLPLLEDADASINIKGVEKFLPPTLEEFKNYFKENGYSIEVAERAWKGYDVAKWHKANGDPVKNWKQTAINVWFKDNNKSKDKAEDENKFIVGSKEYIEARQRRLKNDGN